MTAPFYALITPVEPTMLPAASAAPVMQMPAMMSPMMPANTVTPAMRAPLTPPAAPMPMQPSMSMPTPAPTPVQSGTYNPIIAASAPPPPPVPADGKAIAPPPGGGWGYTPEFGWGYFMPQSPPSGPAPMAAAHATDTMDAHVS